MNRLLAILFSPIYMLSDWLWLRSGGRKRWEDHQTGKPGQIEVVTTNICNANCSFCAYQYQELPWKIMSLETFNGIVDQFSEAGGGSIGLSPLVGEALTDKTLVEKIAYARGKENITDIWLTTNAILLTKEKFVAMVNAGLTTLQISCSGFDREEYKRIYRVDSFVQVWVNLIDIARTPEFDRISKVIWMRTDRLFHGLGENYRKLKSIGYDIVRLWAYDNWSGRIKWSDLTGWMFIKPPRLSKKIPCAYTCGSLKILSDGQVTACGCRDVNADSELMLGNIKTQPLLAPLAWRYGRGMEGFVKCDQ